MANIYPILSQLSKRNTNDNALLCAVCLQVPINVVDSKCCSSLFCWECAMKSDRCPNCNALVEEDNFHANIPIQRILDSMEFPCKYECFTIITASERVAHELVCPNKLVECPNSIICGSFPRNDLQYHLSDCPYRDYFCTCGVVLPYLESEDHKANVCGQTVVACPHGCDEKVERRNLTNHVNNDCLNTPVICEFSEHGCDAAPLKSEYKRHLDENVHVHLSLLNSVIKKQAKEISDLKKQRNVSPTIELSQVFDNLKNSSSQFASAINNSQLFSGSCQFISQAVPQALTAWRSVTNQLALRHAIEMVLSLLLFSIFVPGFITMVIMFYSFPRSVWHLCYRTNVEKAICWFILGLSATLVSCGYTFSTFLIVAISVSVIGNRFVNVVLRH